MSERVMFGADRAFTNEIENEYLYDSIFDLDKDTRNEKTIFIAIPSYRDEMAIDTIESAILNAKNPDRLRFGVSVIYKKEDDKWWETLSKYKNVKVNAKLSTLKTVGLGRQRQDANSFYNEEDYFLQLDAHMKFDMHWDDLLIHHIEGLKALGAKKPLITGYPRGYAPDGFASVTGYYPYYNPMSKEVYFRQRRGHNSVPVMRIGPYPAQFFKAAGFPRHGDRLFTLFETMALGNSVSPAQIFADGQYIKDVPANTEIRFLEEEQYYSILSWMKGYDFYVPRVTGIMHYYSEADGQVLTRRHHPAEEFPNEMATVAYELDNSIGDRIFDPIKELKGTERSFEEYEEFAGLDYKTRRLKSPVNKIIHNPITAYINFCSEMYNYSISDYIDWMYQSDYTWRADVERNENPKEE